MDNKVLSGVKIEQEVPKVYLEYSDVLSSAKATLTEGHAFDHMDREIPSFVKTEQPEVDPENPGSQGYSITPAINFKLMKHELSDTMFEEKCHGLTKVLDLERSNNFQEITEDNTMEPGTSENGCKVSFQIENCNQMSANESSVVEIIENSSLTNTNLQCPNKETVVKQEEFSGWSDDFTVDICSTDPQQTQTQNISDGCDANVNVGMNLDGVENSYKVHTCEAFTKVGFHKLYKCDVSGACFANSGSLKRHKRTHTGENSYKCDVCNASFTQSGNLNHHMRTHTGEKPYKCDVCGAAFIRSGHLISHERTHTGEKIYKCDVCNASYTQYGNLNQHMRTHTGEKPYKCDVCGAAFTGSGHLISHKRTHSREKPYKCDVCGTSCARSESLNRHMRTHTGEKPYKCDMCSASFTVSGNLKRHMRTHSGVKPYKCDMCGASFTESGYLKRHKRTHTGEKPYKCDVCGASCTQHAHLITHKRTHTGETPYECDVCGASFTRSGNLKSHKRKHTGEKP